MNNKTVWYVVGGFVAGVLVGSWIVGAQYRGMGGMWDDMMHHTTYYGATRTSSGGTMMIIRN
ncbi:MAG: hypothetical protein WCO52_02105 [bacterium]